MLEIQKELDQFILTIKNTQVYKRVPTAEKQGKRKSGSEKTAGSVQNEKL